MSENGEVIDMGETIYNLAFDFGASSGRMILSKFENGKIELEELHRFSNDPVRIGKNFYWDTFRLYHELKQGLKKAAAKKIPIQSLAIDTWGVDYALIDKDGNVIGNPINYRDDRTIGVIEEIGKIVPLSELYASTGIQFMNFNTLFQLYADKKMRPDVYEKAARLLFMPELFGYFLTGKMYNEYTFASTGQLLDAKKRDCDYDQALRPAHRYLRRTGKTGHRYRRTSSGSGRRDRTFRREGHCSGKPRHRICSGRHSL